MTDDPQHPTADDDPCTIEDARTALLCADAKCRWCVKAHKAFDALAREPALLARVEANHGAYESACRDGTYHAQRAADNAHALAATLARVAELEASIDSVCTRLDAMEIDGISMEEAMHRAFARVRELEATVARVKVAIVECRVSSFGKVQDACDHIDAAIAETVKS